MAKLSKAKTSYIETITTEYVAKNKKHTFTEKYLELWNSGNQDTADFSLVSIIDDEVDFYKINSDSVALSVSIPVSLEALKSLNEFLTKYLTDK